MSYEEEIQKLGLGKEVFLYEIDLAVLGGGMYYFTPMSGEQEGLADGMGKTTQEPMATILTKCAAYNV